MSHPSVLIMTAVEAEKQAVLKGIGQHPIFIVKTAGVGPIEAAVQTTMALSQNTYTCVISAGIGGGFASHVELEQVVIASAIHAADLGAETMDGYSSIEALGFGKSIIKTDHERSLRLTKLLQERDIPVIYAPILTLSTVTGTEQTAAKLQQRYPDAAAEAMEGFGVASAAKAFGIPALEMRAISNYIGPRDRDEWRIPEALQRLSEASAQLKEVWS